MLFLIILTNILGKLTTINFTNQDRLFWPMFKANTKKHQQNTCSLSFVLKSSRSSSSMFSTAVISMTGGSSGYVGVYSKLRIIVAGNV